MRYIAFLFLLTFSISLSAQSTASKYAYCEVKPFCNTIPFGFEIYVDLGIREVGPFANQIVVRNTQTGKRQSFPSRMQALNFMIGRGWELVEIFTVGESSQPVYFMRFPLGEWELDDFLTEESRALFEGSREN